MKKIAMLALCLFAPLTSAGEEMEEVVVKARQIKVVLIKLSENHRQHPITKNWYYVAEKETSQSK